MLIDGRVCCGENSPGPKTAPRWVTIDTPTVNNPNTENQMQQVSVLVEAGFPKYDYFDEEAIPQCSQRFKWPAIALVLYFTDDIELAYLYGPSKG